MTPIWGVEMDPETMQPKTERIELVHGNWSENGYEVCGEDHCDLPLEDDALEAKYRGFMQMQGMDPDNLPPQMQGMAIMLKGYVSGRPYIEGAWMDKHDGKYYLQYACTGAQYNVYADGVYVSDSPLGPFKLAQNNRILTNQADLFREQDMVRLCAIRRITFGIHLLCASV